MIIKLHDRLLGRHCHTAVFIGKDIDHLQKAGDLVMEQEEWTLFGAMLRLGVAATHDRVVVLMPDSHNMELAFQEYNKEK